MVTRRAAPRTFRKRSRWPAAGILHCSTRVFTVAAREIRARGVQLVLAPVVDVGRDPRWGRIEETYGEDPVPRRRARSSQPCAAFRADTLPLAKDRVFATLKHMTGHGQPESGTNVGPANISERVLREMFFPPFAAAVKRGNAQAVMPSYNEIDGVPSHANRWLLQRRAARRDGLQGRGRQRLLRHRGSACACITSSPIRMQRGRARAARPASTSTCRMASLTPSCRERSRRARHAGRDRHGRAPHAAPEVPRGSLRASLRGRERTRRKSPTTPRRVRSRPKRHASRSCC